ncbi:hypothetical protein HDV04_005067 [Boothiomyces sp. JEL0838]|nr:hypothetical protein HDV04_005067 [Boothiomyces sp. JEL0838]
MSVVSHSEHYSEITGGTGTGTGNDSDEFEFESDSDDEVLDLMTKTLNLESDSAVGSISGRRPSKTDFSSYSTRQFQHFNQTREYPFSSSAPSRFNSGFSERSSNRSTSPSFPEVGDVQDVFPKRRPSNAFLPGTGARNPTPRPFKSPLNDFANPENYIRAKSPESFDMPAISVRKSSLMNPIVNNDGFVDPNLRRNSQATMASELPARRNSQLKILSENKEKVAKPQRNKPKLILDTIDEDQEYLGGMPSISRSNTWSNNRNRRSSSLMDYSTTNFDTCILSSMLLKENRNGNFQKRLVRFDGTLFVCMSAAKASLPPKKGTVADMDLKDSPHTTINTDLFACIKDYYPAGSTFASLARSLISEGREKYPDPNSKKYYIPKWVIPIHEIKAIITNIDTDKPESSRSLTFTIVTVQDYRHTFKALSANQLLRWKLLIEFMIENKSHPNSQPVNTDLVSDTAQVTVSQVTSVHQYMLHQDSWKRALKTNLAANPNAKRSVTTIQLSENGLKILPFEVIQTRGTPKKDPLEPTIERPQSRQNHSRFANKRTSILDNASYAGSIRRPSSTVPYAMSESNSFQTLNENDILNQLDELDEQLRKIKPVPIAENRRSILE